MRVYVYEGKDIEEVKKKALTELNKGEEEVFIKSRAKEEGVLFKGKKQQLEILVKDEIIDYLKKLLFDITDKMGIKINIEGKKRENCLKINILSDYNSILIGKNGRNLYALQKILKHSIFNNTGFYVNIILDIEDYKEKQLRFLKNEVKKKAKEVEKSGKEIKLRSINSYERRLVHETLSSMNVITESEGEEPNRYVVIKPKKK